MRFFFRYFIKDKRNAFPECGPSCDGKDVDSMPGKMVVKMAELTNASEDFDSPLLPVYMYLLVCTQLQVVQCSQLSSAGPE